MKSVKHHVKKEIQDIVHGQDFVVVVVVVVVAFLFREIK